jgi:hypothetical protein
MQLAIASDALYLTEPKARSRAGGLHYLTNHTPNPDQPLSPHDPLPPINSTIHIHCSIMKNILSSATEAELSMLSFDNLKDGTPLCLTLAELGHQQQATRVNTNNACSAASIANDTVKQCCSKAINVHFYWVHDRVCQGHFLIYWAKGKDNLADYFTRHHSLAHHHLMHSHYLLSLHHPS